MEDFTESFKFKNKAKQLEFNVPNMPKAGFIASRMNKDNFWNLVYFVGMFSGISTAFMTKFMILSWITIIGIIWLVKRNADVTFDKMEQDTPMFIINGNKRVNVTCIGFIGLLIISFGLVVGLLALIEFIVSDILKITDTPILLDVMSMSLLISLPALLCILKNIPIAVYFKKEAWIRKYTSGSYGSGDHWNYNSHHNSSMHSSRQRESIVTSPRYRYLSCNIYHRK